MRWRSTTAFLAGVCLVLLCLVVLRNGDFLDGESSGERIANAKERISRERLTGRNSATKKAQPVGKTVGSSQTSLSAAGEIQADADATRRSSESPSAGKPADAVAGNHDAEASNESAPDVGAAGSVIRGRVVLRGTPPAERPIDMSADAACKAMHSTVVTTRHYVVGERGGLANVFVCVKVGLEGRRFEPSTQPVILDQVRCMFEPYVFGVQVGQPLEVVNSDDTLHNVKVESKANQGFSKGQPVKGMKFRRVFTRAETAMRIGCDVHPWMRAYLHIVDHPFFDTTDESGAFEITGLPEGRYTIETWHPRAGTNQFQAVVPNETAEFLVEYEEK